MERFSFTLPANKEYVIAARLLATSLAGVAGFDVEKIEDIRLAVGEACNNAVIHGKSTDSIDMHIELDQEMISISIKDRGPGFDTSRLGAVDLEAYDGSGLGLFIIDSVMDEVKLSSSTNEGTVIQMTKKK
ncbi:ATP-binding protein [Guggenheimella bovis]